MPLVVTTRRIPDPGRRILAAAGFRLRVAPADRSMPALAVRRFVRGADAVVSFIGDTVDERFLEAAGHQLKIVANHAIGYDNVDLAACARRGVSVANAPGPVNVTDVADFAFALLLAASRRIVEADRYTRAGKFRRWTLWELVGASLAGKTLGIVGMGRIGFAVAQRAVGFGLGILYYDPLGCNVLADQQFRARCVTLPQLLRASDFITLHTPLSPATHHLIGARQFAQMKRTAILVNTARGAVVDEAALVAALRTRRIAGAGLDVYEREPTLAPGLTKLANVVLAPHLASATREAREELATVAATNVVAALHGKRPPNLVG